MKNTELLRLNDLPVFSSYEDLSNLCHISTNELNKIIYNPYPFYRRYPIWKKSGGMRTIFQPNKTVKAIQAWILREILDKIQPSDYATAFRKNISILDNVSPHQENRFFLCLDIADFFPSISKKRVYILFLNIGYGKKQAKILSKLCTCSNLLPQGGVTSPAISNLVVNKLDRRLSGYVCKKNIIYTRYADDMTFSSNNRNVLNSSIGLIKHIIEDEGFDVNSKKTHFLGPRKCCNITGLIKNSSKPQFGIGKKKKNWMRSVIFNMAINKKTIDKKYQNKDSVLGWLNYARHVDKKSYQYLKRYCVKLGFLESSKS